jgi:hypothetical protein
MKVLPGFSVRSLCIMPLSVATMNSVRVHVARRLEDGAGGAHGIGQRHHVGGRLGVHQHLGLGMLFFQRLQLEGLELVVHDAGAVPEHHVGAGFALDVAAQVAVGRPQDLLAAVFERAHDVQRATDW